ncbi:MAG: anaerobic glycerol-3-phosphate dehydrogenase subunit A [Tidjanibacter sp.]|nr:anaerobic glycerol-3-phosphate dehydrogenase subunit A [Tidjanibacter sp.]
MKRNGKYDVIIIGGGATGAGTARDCALRGLSVLLVERKDFATGATGRNHGLLHSGARYAVTDRESAAECIGENRILRTIARHCVEPTDGLFISLPEDDLGYQTTFVEACHRAGILAEAISPEEARRLEPSVNPALVGAVRVPDAAIDPFRLVSANVLDARLHGAEVLTYHEVVDFIRTGNCIEGVVLRDASSGELKRVEAKVTVNAGGIWGHLLARKAGVEVGMIPAKGSLLVFGHRVNQMVINRCRKPADADILVPGDTICLIGTTSDRIPFEDIDKNEVLSTEVDVLLREGAKLAPSLATTRILRAYSGVRPLVAADDDPTGRSVSRGIVCLDHAERDGLEGFVTITGGKLMTYRLMAEMATDLICRKLGRTAFCTTATTPLPGSKSESKRESRRGRREFISMRAGEKGAEGRHGDRVEKISFDKPTDAALVCECEQVSVAEIKYAIESLDATTLVDLKRRTRLGMGTCQGHICAVRAAGLLGRASGDSEGALSDVASFVNERWRGVCPIAWGDSLVEAQFTQWFYEGVCGLGEIVDKKDREEMI